MGRRRHKLGKCHICGNVGPLSFEHVPPRAAFNDHKVMVRTGERLIKSLQSEQMPWDSIDQHGEERQRGMGAYTLCNKCNNDTGAWYASAYVDFLYKGVIVLKSCFNQLQETIKINFPEVYPLRIIKQIITMFASINSPFLFDAHEDLRRFVLNHDLKGLNPEKYGIYIYLLRGKICRYIGRAGLLTHDESKARIISELSFFPFGYVLEFDPKDKKNYCNIISFANEFDYDQISSLTITMPVLENNTPFPLDYRTREQIIEDYIRNKLDINLDKKLM